MLNLIICLFVFTSPQAVAKKRYSNVITSFYSEYPEVKKRKCQNCHSKTSLKLNAYGLDFADLKSDFPNLKDVFAELENYDSDEDGVLTIDELEAGTHPGKD